jgi:hypothetical protein
VRFVEAQGVHVVVADVLDPPSIQARTDRHRACRGLHRGALVAEAIMRCAQATVYDNSGSKGPASWLDDRRIRRRLPRLAGRDTGAASRALADAIDRRSSNTTAGTGEGADDDANPPFGQAHCGDGADSRSRARDHATGVR